jgi:hypothetical protein
VRRGLSFSSLSATWTRRVAPPAPRAPRSAPRVPRPPPVPRGVRRRPSCGTRGGQTQCARRAAAPGALPAAVRARARAHAAAGCDEFLCAWVFVRGRTSPRRSTCRSSLRIPPPLHPHYLFTYCRLHPCRATACTPAARVRAPLRDSNDRSGGRGKCQISELRGDFLDYSSRKLLGLFRKPPCLSIKDASLEASLVIPPTERLSPQTRAHQRPTRGARRAQLLRAVAQHLADEFPRRAGQAAPGGATALPALSHAPPCFSRLLSAKERALALPGGLRGGRCPVFFVRSAWRVPVSGRAQLPVRQRRRGRGRGPGRGDGHGRALARAEASDALRGAGPHGRDQCRRHGARPGPPLPRRPVAGATPQSLPADWAACAIAAVESHAAPDTRASTRPETRRPPPPPSRTNWTRLVPPSVLTGHVSSLLPY